jgi:hypothetical protein
MKPTDLGEKHADPTRHADDHRRAATGSAHEPEFDHNNTDTNFSKVKRISLASRYTHTLDQLNIDSQKKHTHTTCIQQNTRYMQCRQRYIRLA